MSTNADTDSLLDVFTSVDVEDKTNGALYSELTDVSIHSLLEQTRKVAEDIKTGHIRLL